MGAVRKCSRRRDAEATLRGPLAWRTKWFLSSMPVLQGPVEPCKPSLRVLPGGSETAIDPARRSCLRLVEWPPAASHAQGLQHGGEA